MKLRSENEKFKMLIHKCGCLGQQGLQPKPLRTSLKSGANVENNTWQVIKGFVNCMGQFSGADSNLKESKNWSTDRLRFFDLREATCRE